MKNFRGGVLKRIFGVVVLVMLCGCTELKQYRTDLTACRVDAENPAGCTTATIEETPSYVLGFVEVDDQGWLWNRDQLKVVLDRIEAEEKTNRLLIVTFVHGWKHNADFNDENVKMFRKNLRVMSGLERAVSRKEGRAPRKVVGVYCGWRGLSQKLPVLKEFTFWERKSTAEEVGRGALGEVFMRLEDIRNESHQNHTNEPSQTRLIIVGHSFGGAATYFALSGLLTERAVHEGDHVTEGRYRFADLVMLINPAFEAARFETLEEAARSENLRASNQVSIAIFTSKADDATKKAFPLGRYFSTLFDKYRDGKQRKANVTAVGHYKPFITHDLVDTEQVETSAAKKNAKVAEMTTEDTDKASERVLQIRSQVRGARRMRQEEALKEEVHFDGSDLIPRNEHDPRFPLYVVAVDPKIIPNHTDIDEKAFIRFLGQFVIAFLPPD